MFFLVLAVGLRVVIATAVRRGSQTALALAVALVLVLPCWMYRDFGGVRVDVRQAIGLVAITACLLDPRVQLGGRIVLCDVLVVALAAANLTSEMLNDVVTVTMAANIMMIWLVPYTIGRLLSLDTEGMRRAVPWIAKGVAILALLTVVESVTRVNIIHIIAGHAGSLQGNTDIRWGMRRAEGTLTHPIFFGLLLVMTLPWTIEAARWARAKMAPDWWRWMPWITALGTFFTMSRGPQLGVLGTAAVVTWFRSRAWRPIITCAAVGAVVVAIVGQNAIIDVLHAWSGENDEQQIEIRGELHAYSGTTHRTLQFLVFREAVENTGWFGYGSTPLMAGKNLLPFVEEHLRQRFSSIDNHYLEYTLRCGFAGIGLFLAVGLTSVAYLVGPAFKLQDESSWFAAALVGSQLMVTILLASVWFPTDFSFVWLLNAGMAASLRSATLGSRAASSTPRRVQPLPRHLSPGHPTWAPNT